MSTNKHFNKICAVFIAVMLVITLVFLNADSFGLLDASYAMEYESTIFDNSYVHTIDISMDDWDNFIETCESEDYSPCTVTVDGQKYPNIAIRAKGNTSLANVKMMDSQRYSFKLEFDHYIDGCTLDGLDKLCLNNLIQDNTMMKDYLAYQLMADFGADAPLCSYAYVTVNGEDWGLYLAVESPEESFLKRNYGRDYGNLYKPDSMGFGGGRGNGKDFKMDDFDFGDKQPPDATSGGGFSGGPSGKAPDFDGKAPDFAPPDATSGATPAKTSGGAFDGKRPDFDGGPGGMGKDDVKLQYIDDDPDSYSNIFNSAKTDISKADKTRLIESLNKLSTYSDIESIIDTDEVLRYFVVHNFVCNGDSYTGNMVHNYYLYESDGQLSMIPWDYNLAYGTFMAGNASSSVNASINNPVSGGELDDRPMVGWIFSSEEYTNQYHELFSQFIKKWFSDGQLEQLIADTAEMIRPYVEKDPTKFCTTEDFETGINALSNFVSLRAEAVKKQLSGDDTPVNTDNLVLSDMGSMGSMGKDRDFKK